ncbi:hypothetical protein ACET3Z_021493 [Daucus carota]
MKLSRDTMDGGYFFSVGFCCGIIDQVYGQQFLTGSSNIQGGSLQLNFCSKGELNIADFGWLVHRINKRQIMYEILDYLPHEIASRKGRSTFKDRGPEALHGEN